MPTSLRDLYIEELQDLYSAEGQIVEALPQMSAAVTSPHLKRAFDEHLDQTRVQRERLELICKALEVKPAGHHCAGMEGLIKEGRERLRQDGGGDVKDAALIAAAQRVEHYEIAGYGTARTYARLLGDCESERLLQQTLDEEGATDHRLTDLAMSGINQAAESHGDSRDVRQWSRLRYLDVDDLDDSVFNYRELTIRNRSHEDLGALDGFIVESAAGRPLYYVVDSGGWFIGRRYLIPVGQVSFEATRKALVVNLDRDTIKRYPEFSTNAFLAMSDDEVRRYERRVLHTIAPAATTSTAYWEAYERLPEYTQPDWLRPLARPREQQPIGRVAAPETRWRGERATPAGRDIRRGEREPVSVGTESSSAARPEERVIAQQDEWVRDPRDNTRDNAGERMAGDRSPHPIERDDDLAR
jgi:ferritin-like metal-binding protein YciE